MSFQQNKFSNIPVERKEQEIITSTTTTYSQPQASHFQQQPISLDKNISGAEHKLDPSLSFELKYHEPLHHVSQTQIHDASKPVLQTSSDESIRQQTHSSSQMLNEIKTSASSMANTISHKAADLSHQAKAKINELGKDIFPSSSASTTLSSSSSSKMPSVVHTLPSDVKQEVLHHAPLHHVSRAEIDDQSSPVLSTPTDSLLSKQQETAAPSTSIAEKLSAVGASISHSADVLFDKVASAMSPRTTQQPAYASSSNVPLVKHNDRITIPKQMKEEITHHEQLHHVHRNEINDKSKPIIQAETDVLKPTPTPSTVTQISNAAHVVAEKLEHMADSISNKAADIYQSLSHTNTKVEEKQVLHKLPSDVKQEVLHHAPLHHVSRADIDDQSSPVLSTPTDSMLEKQGPPLTEQISKTLSNAANSVAKSMPTKQEVSQTMHIAAEKLPSKQQIQSSASTLGASISSAAHVAAEKLSQVGASISSAYHDATKFKPQHTLPTSLQNDIKFNQPQLKHVPTSDHSAPLLFTETDQHLPKIPHHNIGIATPQNPHVQLHPGKIDLSHVQATIPKDHSNNMFSNQKFDNTSYEVNEGGLGWSIPLDSNGQQIQQNQGQGLGQNTMMNQQQLFDQQQLMNQQQQQYIPQQQSQQFVPQQQQQFIPQQQQQFQQASMPSQKLEQQQPVYGATVIQTTTTTTTPSA